MGLATGGEPGRRGDRARGLRSGQVSSGRGHLKQVLTPGRGEAGGQLGEWDG